jgi:succinate dehydrogenase / fumarate reductase cytochrome b subunit
LTRQGFITIWPGGAWFVIYAIGLIASVYHFVNGLCTFCITWGITIGDVSRRRATVLASGLGIVLLIWGFMSLAALRADPAGTPDVLDTNTPIATVPQPHQPANQDR